MDVDDGDARRGMRRELLDGVEYVGCMKASVGACVVVCDG